MRLPIKVNYCILAAIVLITLIYRYPLGVVHEMGSDTTYIHTMTNSVTQDGFASWILHPTSIFGLYALSYPSAAPFILAGSSLISNISVEGMILLFGLILAIVGAISAYLLAKMIKDNDIFAHSIALLFTLAPFYIKDTTWVASSRGFIVAILPFFFLLLIKHVKTKDVRYLLLSFVIFLVLGSLHRMGLLVVLVYIAYILAIPLHLVTMKLRFSLLKFEKPLRVLLVFTALIIFLVIFYIQFAFPGISGADVVEQYERGFLVSGRSFPVLLLNMSVSFIGRVGLMLPLMLLGLIMYVWKRPKESSDKFLLLTTFMFLPLLSLRDYMIEFLIPIFTVLAVYGLITIVNIPKNKRRAGAVVLVMLLMASSGFSWLTKDRWRQSYITDQSIPDSTYDVAIYVGKKGWGTISTNEGLSGGRIAAISKMPNMPLGGASMHFNSAQQLMWGFVNGDNLQVRLLDLTRVSFDTDEIYVPVNVRNAQFDWEVMLSYREPDTANQTMDYYDTHFVISENSLFPKYNSYGYNRLSCLFGDDGYSPGDPRKVCIWASYVVQKQNYAFFSNSAATIWLVRGG